MAAIDALSYQPKGDKKDSETSDFITRSYSIDRYDRLRRGDPK